MGGRLACVDMSGTRLAPTTEALYARDVLARGYALDVARRLEQEMT